jgi:hypothetical protein
MPNYRITVLNDLCNGKLKKGTTGIVTTISDKPDFTKFKKAIGFESSLSYNLYGSNFLVEKIS